MNEAKTNLFIKILIAVVIIMITFTGVFIIIKNQGVYQKQISAHERKIPKIIHYCWFGPKKMGPLEQKCINSWKKHMPDYKIMEWNDSHLHLVNIPFVREAYMAGKYAFVADVFRLYALAKYGGIYFDTDTEVLKNLDEFMALNFFCGFENWNENTNVAMTPLGSTPNNPIITDFFKENYQNSHFILNRELNFPITVRFKNFIIKRYNKPLNYSKTTELEDGAKIYPYNYFISYTPGTSYAMHHYRASWNNSMQPKVEKLYSFMFITLWKYTKVNPYNDEFIWNLDNKVLFKIKTGNYTYIVVSN